jgi:maltose alpha-D-glucosyltransferase/alpha-amylase
MLLAEANQWPEDAVAYFGAGDECHVAFHFPVMPRLFMAIRTEDRFPIVEILQETPAIPEVCQWALFLRNHDELTLEMVTDEDRDYMYRVYAQDPQARINLGIRRRLAPLLGNHHRRIELMNGLLFSLPGTPLIYYGDEIGMGDNIYLGDRNGVRTPMQWSADRNAGFSRANPQRLYLPVIIDPEYHYEAINVEAQLNNPHSRLWWMKRLIALRKRFRAFGLGTLEFLHPENRKVLAFIRRYEDECILVLANLSRFVHCVELDLSGLKGMVPVEIFGRTAFPPIGEHPYFFTLGPHNFYWFALERQRIGPVGAAPEEVKLPLLTVGGPWHAVFQGEAKVALEEILPTYLQRSRWFGGKGRQVKGAKILDAISVPSEPFGAHLAVVEVRYTEGEPELYALPLTYGPGRPAALGPDPGVAVARLRLMGKVGKGTSEEGMLYDALWDRGFCMALLESVARRRHVKGTSGEILASPTRAFAKVRGPVEGLEPSMVKAEQTNTSVVFGDRLILKMFRRLEQGVNPDLEIGRFLTERAAFAHIPPVAGALEYRRGRAEPMTLAILQGFVPNQGDAWQYMLDALGHYYERALAHPEVQAPSLPRGSVLALSEQDLPPLIQDAAGPYLASVELLGRRTAELHIALAQDPEDPAFAPEPFSDFYRQGLYHGMLGMTDRALQLLRPRVKDLPKDVQGDARRVLDLEGDIRKRFRQIRDRKISGMRIRCHGDYHLGQLLYTGKDFVIIDFEGEPTRSLSERRLKRSALKDVAGMLRSFHYAAHVVLFEQAGRGVGHSRPEARTTLGLWGRFWYLWVSAVFVKAYLRIAGETPLVPRNREELQILLDALLLEKAIYELEYELNNRPDWVKIPLQGILQLLEADG